ncbi:MAG: LysR family transcriptional regulator [Opitutaceae bacterium]
MAMNLHHLELFYYVARHGGISAAVRHMPYGVQQPAVSSQIKLLEEDLGVRLFERQPFALTEEGQILWACVQPFFESLAPVRAQLRQRGSPQLRIGAAEVVLRNHLPRVMQQVKRAQPGLRLTLRSGLQPELEAALRDREIDLAVVPVRGRLPARVHSRSLLSLPLVLLVPTTLRMRSAAELLARGRNREALISLPASETVCRLFQKGLKRRGVEWAPSVEVASMSLITRYVADGYGVGLSLLEPEVVKHPQVRVLPLEGFDEVEVMALWLGRPSPLVQVVLDEIDRYVAQHWPEPAA